MKVFIYRNLRKKCYSVRDESTGLVSSHAIGDLWVKNAKLVVQPAGRDRVRREGRKNVHAGVRGTLCSVEDLDFSRLRESSSITYDPYKYDSFVRVSDKQPVLTADYVELGENGVTAYYCRG